MRNANRRCGISATGTSASFTKRKISVAFRGRAGDRFVFKRRRRVAVFGIARRVSFEVRGERRVVGAER